MLLILIILFINNTYAFTNGTLLPSYLCNLKAQAQGAPKSLADIIPFLTDSFTATNISATKSVNLTDPTTSITTNGSTIISYIHHQKVWPFSAQNLCTAKLSTDLLSLHSPVNITVSAIDQTQSIVGLMVWVQQTSNSNIPVKIGKWIVPGRNMTIYPWLCNSEDDIGQTIVHETALHKAAPVDLKYSSPNMTWMPPCQLPKDTQVQIQGICVTQAPRGVIGGGFGRFNINVTVI